MKPFNLQEALSNQEKFGDPKVVTRDGRKVEQIAYFPQADDNHRLQALLLGHPYPTSFCGDGLYSRVELGAFDLFMATTKVTKWVNVMRGWRGDICMGTTIHDSEKAAIEYGANCTLEVIATVPISWEE